MVIYALVDPRNSSVFYIGRTKDLKHRIIKHNSIGTSVGTLKNQRIREIRQAGYKIEHFVLDEVKEEGAPFWERYYTDLFRSWGIALLNNVHYKFGNQTSFTPDSNLKPLVAVTRNGSLHKRYPSTKEAKRELGKIGIGQNLMRIKKSAGGMVWFYEEEYDKLSKEEIMKVVSWSNTKGHHRTPGAFKKGAVPRNKVDVPESIVRDMINDRASGSTVESIQTKYGYTRSVVRRVLKSSKISLTP
jgi:hypothetical protein